MADNWKVERRGTTPIHRHVIPFTRTSFVPVKKGGEGVLEHTRYKNICNYFYILQYLYYNFPGWRFITLKCNRIVDIQMF